MSANTYELCCNYLGRRVRINDCYGNVHYGRIMKVDRKQVYIRPNRIFGLGIGFWGGYPGAGFGYGIALGTILGVALVSAFDF